MKNYKVFLGIAALALVFGLVFTGCSDPTQVEGDVGRYNVAHGPKIDASTLTVVKGTGTATGYLIVNFKPADNAISHTVYRSPDKKLIVGSTSTVTIGNGLAADGNPTITTGIPDYTKASAYFSTSSTDTTAYYIGVRAQDVLGNSGDIVWSATAVAAR
ncbi:hypothetical protein FACS1894109_05000 [Spirochaetia bacterium]|nr:hypothetical protein FACS1894109_05000 [Spirochaetia bacterium]